MRIGKPGQSKRMASPRVDGQWQSRFLRSAPRRQVMLGSQDRSNPLPIASILALTTEGPIGSMHT